MQQAQEIKELFFQSLWIFSFVMHMVRKVQNIALFILFYAAPDSLFFPLRLWRKFPINIIHVSDELGRNLSNKIHLFINLDMDENQVFNVQNFAEMVGANRLLILYTMDSTIAKLQRKCMGMTQMKKNGMYDEEMPFQGVFVNLGAKMIYYLGKKSPDHMIFGELVLA